MKFAIYLVKKNINTPLTTVKAMFLQKVTFEIFVIRFEQYNILTEEQKKILRSDWLRATPYIGVQTSVLTGQRSNIV